MATIKAIETRSVHQIQSGQVIVDLVSVVKELVENSLDAGASSIEVRFKNNGLDSIEVQDNGKGIAPEDFETIALKHYTSKLSSYEDLTSLDTFGFRGEALSSLCALSRFHIVTARAQDGAVGKKLEFETSGKLSSASVIAAQRGTTVSVEGLFENLPVRRKELEKNIKREYGKVISHLYAYACISVGVRFSVSNQMPKGKKVSVFSTKSNTTTKENITNVFGAKTLLALVKLDLHLEMEPSKGPATQSARNWSTQALDRSIEVSVQGHISKPVFGEGRQAPDRQMFFVNSRPCSLPQVAKAFNEVYRSFNVSQTPFIFANLVMDTNAYDVNVSPDKRTIMLHDQAALLDSLKKCLTELFEQTDHTVPQSQLPNKKLPSYQPLTMSRRDPEARSPTDEDQLANTSASNEDESSPADPSSHREQTPRHGTPASLIQDWAERDTELRKETPMPKKRRLGTLKDQAAPVEGTALPHDALINRTAESGLHSGSPETSTRTNDARVDRDTTSNRASHEEEITSERPNQAPDPMGSPYDDLFSQRPPHLSKRVKTIDDPAHQEHGDNNEKAIPEVFIEPEADAATAPSTVAEAEPPEQEEPEIPVLTASSQKATPGPVQNAFDRMRAKRTPQQTAEITIGDQMTTTVLGSSPPYKKRRIHQPVHSQSIAQFGGSPLLARELRNFAAPGSQLEIDSSNVLPNHTRGADQSDIDSDEEPPEAADHEGPRRGVVQDEAAANRRDVPIPSSTVPTSDPLDELVPAPVDDDEYDEDYIAESEKKLHEDEKVARLIQEAELATAQPTEEKPKRASQVLKNTGNRKESTLRLTQYLKTSVEGIKAQMSTQGCGANGLSSEPNRDSKESAIVKNEIDDSNAEIRLSLTVSKADFERMVVVGQFNLGFILATRPAMHDGDEDELFIIDQHAADEKYNYERLQRTVTLQNQRLVRPKPLDLTAVEEEIVLSNSDALKANGFEIETTSYFNDEETEGRRCRLITLPMSKEKTFEISDLEELLHLLSETPAGSAEIPRPKKVQSMLAMRACRSSIMVGKTLTLKQMVKVVRHMGEMEKPWNCPHGRPTMRHLAGLGAWNAWKEGNAVDEDNEMGGLHATTDWKTFLDSR